MVDQTQDMITVPKKYLSDNVVAVNVSEDDYLAGYGEGRHEWIEGVVIQMSPASDRHQELSHYFLDLFRSYFSLNQIGRVRSEPFTMKTLNAYRQPDLQVILNDNPNFTNTGMIGSADICLEIVSQESIERDYGTKFQEYQAAGVREYWIIDPLRNDARFFQLVEENLYAPIPFNENNIYQTPLLPNLKINVSTLWQEDLPNIIVIVDTVKSMFSDA